MSLDGENLGVEIRGKSNCTSMIRIDAILREGGQIAFLSEDEVNYLNHELFANPNDVIEVTLDGQANVLLLDSINYDHYRKGESYRYYGGLARVSPMRLVPPYLGNWHVVVDLGGYTGKVRAGVRILKGANALEA